ncbi:carboxymuconolactone decarboxylase family protein (plasmid) [Variovorax paradoxus]|nr:carboxymuconolactone decarboxylase family protein [Variovorax paradoxus]
MDKPRLPWIELSPQSFQAMTALNTTIARSQLTPVLRELVRTRVSQMNGCAFGFDLHVRDLRDLGECWQRINNVSTWRGVGLYDEQERAALGWAEALTRLGDGCGDQDEAYFALKPYFTDEDIVDLTWLVAATNTWNRVAIGMRIPPSTHPLD